MDISEQLKKAAKNAILPVAVIFGGSANAEPMQVKEPSEQIITNEQPIEKVAFIYENGDYPSQEIIDEALKSGRLKEYIMKDEVYDLYSIADNSFLSNLGLKSSPPIYYDAKSDPNQKATANLVTTNEGNSIVIINNNALEINKSEKLTYSYDNADQYKLTEITKENNHGFSLEFFDKYQEMAEKTGITPPKLYFDKENTLDFIFSQENIVLSTNFENLVDSMKVISSEENKTYFYFLKEDAQFQSKLELIMPLISRFPQNDKFYTKVEEKYMSLQKERDK
ncbi:MAG: hypothetical protein WCL30_01565, partial [Pseudomonadota bacterium]